MSETNRITIPVPDNWHCHLREGPLLSFMVKHLVESGFQGGRVLAEPNISRALLNANFTLAYKKVVESAMLEVVGSLEAGFEVVYTIQITEETTPDMIYTAFAAGIRVAKVYPRDVTTNSMNGVVDYLKIYPALKAAEDCGMIVQFHGEHPSKDVQGLGKEADFIFKILNPIVVEFKKLKISLEHLSTAFGVHWIRGHNTNPNMPPRIVGALTPQHLFCTSDDVNGYTPESQYKGHSELICKPMLKGNDDRASLQAAATSGEACFVFGPDDAAHFDSNKGPGGCNCGSFNTTESLAVSAQVFERCNALSMLGVFVENGRKFYGYPPNIGSIVLEKKQWEVPMRYPVKGTMEWVTSMLSGRTLEWKLIQ